MGSCDPVSYLLADLAFHSTGNRLQFESFCAGLHETLARIDLLGIDARMIVHVTLRVIKVASRIYRPYG